MKLIPIEVESYSGAKTEVYPLSFYWMNIKYDIKEIADRWYQAQTTPDAPVADYFKVRTENKSIFIIKHELISGQWFLVSPNEALISYSFN